MEKKHLLDLLRGNPYPGRGILLGKSPDGRHAAALYFIMGRSENSRNRIFVPTEDGIRTQAYDPAKVTDPSLILYHPVRKVRQGLIVTNGDQTDTIRDYLLAGQTFAGALKTRTFEPDKPHYTPRIYGRRPRLLLPVLLPLRRASPRRRPVSSHLLGRRGPPALFPGRAGTGDSACRRA